MAIVIIIALELKWHEKQKAMMAERDKERQDYIAQIFKAQEDERQRIARDLHDDIAQVLMAIANEARTILPNEYSNMFPEAADRAMWIREKTLSIAEDIRRLCLDLRPSILDNVGLVPAIRWLLRRLQQEHNITSRLTVKGEVRKLEGEHELTIFRIAQESINNIIRHSKATKASAGMPPQRIPLPMLELKIV